ncbi:unnamed protein product [Hymenolepis diminuta]|uniref:Microtubule-associated protein n=1 Tax=Hymenolepis diminuta TaxID=6216 RepID=A0A0R3SGU7_HYMDI|nr:unnamed protein product [Hymenolepis diminuta]VUZ46260.1 unnamed protein product [Hymenolepis diminuta]
MDDIDKPVEDYEIAPPMNEEILLDLANGKSSPVSDHFDGKAEHNPPEMEEPNVDVDKHRDESGENSGIFGPKVDNTVISPGLSETPHSLNGSQEMIMKNTKAIDQSHEERVDPDLKEDIAADRNTGSEQGLSYENLNKMNEHIESPGNDYVVFDSETPGETKLEDKSSASEDIHEQTTHDVPEPSEDDTENHGNDGVERRDLAEHGLHEVSEDYVEQKQEHSNSGKQLEQSSSEMEIVNVALQHAEHQEAEKISKSEEGDEDHGNEEPETENVISEAQEDQMDHDSEIPEHYSSERMDQLSPEIKNTPEEHKEAESVPTDVEHQKLTDDEIHEFDTQFVESNVEEHFTAPQQTDVSLPSDESLKFSDSGSLDTVSINPNEEVSEVIEESTEIKEIPEITVEETESHNKEESEENIAVENSLVESNEPKDVQIGTENALNLEESIKPLETTNENPEIFLETPNVSMEEQTLSKAYSRVHETCEPLHSASCEEYEAESVDMNEAKATKHTMELQTIEIYSEPVEIKIHEGDIGHQIVECITPKPEIELETAIAVSAEVPEQEIVMETERFELSEPIVKEEIGKEQVVEVVEAQPTMVNEKAAELEVVRLPPMEITKSVPETEVEKRKITEVVDPLSIQNGESEPVSHIDQSQITSKDESLNGKAPSIEEGKENAIPVNTNGEMNGKEPNISDDELDFDTRYALFVGKVLPGHEIYYLPANKKKVTFRKGGTLDNRQTSSPLWDASLNGMRAKSATLGAPRLTRRRLQPKPTVNDDHLFPDSVTPSKVEKTLSEDDTSASNDGEGSRYDVPFMDDDAFVPKKYRSVVVVDNDSSSESDYSSERRDLIRSEHLAKMDETSLHAGRTEIDGKRNLNHTGGSRWSFGLSICGCLRRRR